MEKIKNSRTASFIAVIVIYIIATVAAVFIYEALPYDFWLNLLIADVAATVITFAFSVIFGNASVYDPYWSIQPPVILVAYALGATMTLPRVLLLISVWFWSIRLTGNWVYTFHGLKYQDWRYTMLKEKTGKFYPIVNFVGIHMVPTLIVYGCILPAVFVMKYDAEWNIGSVIFFLVSVLSAALQFFADKQMHAFRRQKTGGLIRTGLWKYARHPNYLGEIMMWWGVALSAVCVLPQYWYLCAGAFANTVLFLVVSIPMADKRQSKKAGYDEYKSRTRVLLPIKK